MTEDRSQPASLVGAVLDEESRRQADAAAADSEAAIDVATLPGVGGEGVSLGRALDGDGRRLLVTVGAMFGLGLAIFAMTAILASKIAHDYGWSFRFLVQVAILPGFTIVLVSQPLGNYVDRAATNRPLVMRWMLVLSVIALLLSGAAFYRWEFLGVLAFTGVGLLATVPVQTSLLADTFAVRARPAVFAAYIALGATGFVIGPLLVVLGVGVFDGRTEWRIPFFVMAALTAVLAFAAGRLPDCRRGRAEVEEIFHDDGDIRAEHLSTLHALTRFRQIATLRYVTVGLLAMGFGFIGWGLWFNQWLQGHFQVDATDRALLIAAMALPALLLTPLVGRLTGRAFRKAPHRAVRLSAVLLMGFNLALVGWWTHSVGATAVLGAFGFACVVGAIAAILPVAQAVIPPQTRAQGFGAFINSLFVGAFVAGAPMADFWPELERQHTALSIVVPCLSVLGVGLMLVWIALRRTRHAAHRRGARRRTRTRRGGTRRNAGAAAPGAQSRLQLRPGTSPVRRELRCPPR